MEIIRDINSAYITRPTVLTLGSFDGIHRGHQHLISQIVARAKEESGTVSALVTLHPHPKVVLRPNSQLRYLTTIEERLDLLKPLGLDYCVVFPFSLETSQIRAHDFIQLLIDRLSLIEIICGQDFALGYKREGNVEFLRTLGREKGFAVTIVEPYQLDGHIVSSTHIRELIAAGNLEEATRLLGRHPSIRGRVIKGDQRGRTLGFPTANLAVEERRQIPADGIYAARVNIGSRRFGGAANVGVRPTFNKGQRLIEVYILDFDEDLYDQVITVEFVKRLREELKFDTVNALIEQMQKDVVETRKILASTEY
jgi:riboflavin kinase / FMN adenylyltransferase